MDIKIPGLHHVTAIASDPQRNLDFYAGVLGLRFVNGPSRYRRVRNSKKLDRLLAETLEAGTCAGGKNESAIS